MASSHHIILLLTVFYFCPALSADEGPRRLEARVNSLGNGFISITYSWERGSCSTEGTEYTLLLLGMEAPLTTRNSTIDIDGLEFWTHYTVSLRASAPCPQTWLNLTTYTGPGEPHKIKKLIAAPNGDELQLLVEEASMPKAVTSYVLNISDQSQTEISTLHREASRVNDGVWRITVLRKLVPGIVYKISVAPQIVDKGKFYSGEELTVDPRFYAKISNLTAQLYYMEHFEPGKGIRAELAWECSGDDSDFDHFTVTKGKTNEKPDRPIKTNAYKLSLRGLEFNSSYTVNVAAAFRAHGKEMVHTSASITFDTIQKLLPPTDLQVAHLSTSEVLLGWKAAVHFDSGVRISELKFRVEYLTKGRPAQTVIVEAPRAKLTGLERSTTYTAKVTATLEKWVEADAEPFVFETRREDWPTAIIRKASVLSTGAGDKALYDFEWDLPDTEKPGRFEAIVCDIQCFELPISSGKKHLVAELDYHIDYNLTVRTVYIQPLDQTISRLSQPWIGKSTVGRPDAVDFKRIVQNFNSLNLEWEPPKKTRGPINHYHIEVWDAFDSTRKKSVDSSGLHAAIALPPLSRGIYKVTLTAVSVDDTTNQEFRSEILSENPRGIELLPPPTKIETVERSDHSIKLRVVSSSTSPLIKYRVRWIANEPGALEADQFVLDQLEPYTPVDYNVSACFLDSAEEPLCGEPIPFTAMTNVGSPFAVRNFKVVGYENNSLDLTWDAPLAKNGPLDGYIIELAERSNLLSTQVNYTSEPSSSAYLISDLTRGSSYDISIAAYNIDLDSKRMVIGEVSYMSVDFPRSAGWIIPVAVFALLTAIGSSAGGVYAYRKRIQKTNAPAVTYSVSDARVDT
ncbi:uncharacterized protein LOC108863634 [Galendromus occidentalis]|uniref:Uncharacterized protein LOC108863634 n=1 Tax=Galendromus occidentalis TaxID=34638 RepID=A0AAJ7PAL5_9ACAR|nr:uncharacterized protein LOC108863634 [Galendromus occidentalis]